MAKKDKKYVYFYGFGKKHTEGDASMKAILGGKGANLAEMANADLPVPPGFTISTEAVCGSLSRIIQCAIFLPNSCPSNTCGSGITWDLTR